ncbi:MAG: NAD(P)H-dependent glycerol-3-phosphate dehydrogenase [Aquificaceae bacterium]
MNISVLGAGRWAAALSLHLSRLGHRVLIFARKDSIASEINRGFHPYLGLSLPKEIRASADIREVLEFSEVILVCLPVQSIREVISNLDLGKRIVISASKGIEIKTGLRVSEIVKEIAPKAHFMTLSGPSFAKEVAEGLPCAVVLAGDDRDLLESSREIFLSPQMRVYLSTDLAGVELGGSLKNVVAIACGLSDGLGFGENARASLITRGLLEMIRLGELFGAKRETFFGLSGLGDLILTSCSFLSRNYALGFLVGSGKSVEDALMEISQTVEGFYTVKAINELSKRAGLYTPIFRAVYKVLYEGFDPLETALELIYEPPQSIFEIPHRESI